VTDELRHEDELRHGVDPTAENPYEGVEVSDLPEWWRDCLDEFEAHGLYTYVPAHFADGEIVRETVERLEAELGVEVKLLRVGGRPGEAWTVAVDGEEIGSVPWTRLRYGISTVEVSSDEFAELVRQR